MKKGIRGVTPPIVALLIENHGFDREPYAELIEHPISGGVDGLFVLGLSSEVMFSMDRRHDKILRAAVEFAKGRVPVLTEVIDTEINRVKEHIKRAADLGVNAVVATAPFYALQTMIEAGRHFRLLTEASPVPVWVYDIPVCIHTKLPGDLLLCLGKEGVLAGVKDSSGDDMAFCQFCLGNKDAGHPLSLLTGHEVVVDGAYLSGADGSVSGLGNVDPAGYVWQWQAFQAGDQAEVREEQDGLAHLMRIVNVKGVGGFGAGIGSFKTALWLLGIFASNTMPEPTTALSGGNVEHVRDVLREVGLLSQKGSFS